MIYIEGMNEFNTNTNLSLISVPFSKKRFTGNTNRISLESDLKKECLETRSNICCTTKSIRMDIFNPIEWR